MEVLILKDLQVFICTKIVQWTSPRKCCKKDS